MEDAGRHPASSPSSTIFLLISFSFNRSGKIPCTGSRRCHLSSIVIRIDIDNSLHAATAKTCPLPVFCEPAQGKSVRSFIPQSALPTSLIGDYLEASTGGKVR